MLTPYQQARRYAGYLPDDMNRPNDEPEAVILDDLEKEYHRLNFLVDTGDENVERRWRSPYTPAKSLASCMMLF